MLYEVITVSPGVILTDMSKRVRNLAADQILDMAAKIGEAGFQRAIADRGGLLQRQAAVHFQGTNNQAERQPKATGAKGVVMCFSAKDGKFLWQLTHDKLAAGRVNDWPRQGICSSPAVDGDRIYRNNFV